MAKTFLCAVLLLLFSMGCERSVDSTVTFNGAPSAQVACVVASKIWQDLYGRPGDTAVAWSYRGSELFNRDCIRLFVYQ